MMKNSLACIVAMIAMLVLGTGDATAQKAFPGATGYAENVTGGRGGKVYYVTRLDDCSDDNLVPGTFRWALRSGDDAPRTILFAVGGTILTTSPLKANHNNVSILGQSAPGGGICITGYGLELNGVKNYIVRYLRFRAGEVPCYAEAPEGQHVDVNNGSFGVENSANIIVDHCSITWSNEECMTMFDNETTTVQHCIIGEGLYHSWHHKYENNGTSGRGYAMQWGGENCNMHHSLITNCNSRSPRYNGVREENAWLPGKAGIKKHAHDCTGVSDFANNVTFNWGGTGSIYGGEFYASNFTNAPDSLEYYSRTYLTNNYYRPGPTTMSGAKNERYFIRASGSASAKTLGQWYLNGNKFEVDGTYSPKTGVWAKASLEAVNADNYYGIANGLSGRGFSTDNGVSAAVYDNYILKTRPELSGYKPVSAEQAYAETMADCGANLPRLDEVDQRLIDEAAGKVAPKFKGSRVGVGLGIIDTPNDVKLSGKQDKFWYNGEYTNTVNGETFTCYPYLGLNEEDRYAVDGDGDGMPDAYEDAKGLNKNDPSDGAKVAANGYTNLENYLNGIIDGTVKITDYQTSAEYVEPGLAVRPQTVTITFVNTDSSIEGVVPEAMTIAYGSAVTFTNSHSFYKEGYTMVGWNDGQMTYKFGEEYNGYFIQDVTLRPAMTKNGSNLSDRTEDLSIVWDFTKPYAPRLEDGKKGVYTATTLVGTSEIDVRLGYEGMRLSLPASEGAIGTIMYSDGTSVQGVAIGGVLQMKASSADIKSVKVLLPFILDISSHEFHSVKVGNVIVGTVDYHTVEGENERTWSAANNVADSKNFNKAQAANYELVYGNLATIHSEACSGWMETVGQERDAYRNVINPNGNDETQYSGDSTTPCKALNGFLVGQTSTTTYKLYAYIKDCAKVRTYAAGSGSGGDFMQCVAVPLDGSETLSSNNIHKLYKSASFSEYFDLDLDPEMSYRLEWSSVGGVDMMVGAVKFYDKTAKVETAGDAVIMWDWNKETNGVIATPNAVVDPAKAFASATATVGSALVVDKGENGQDPDGNQLYVAQISQTSEAAGCQADHMIEFTITPRAGYEFTPTQVDLNRIYRFQGTGSPGKFDIYFKYGDEDEVSIRTAPAITTTAAVSMKNTNSKYGAQFKATTKPMHIRMYLTELPLTVGSLPTYVQLFGIKVTGTWKATGAVKHKLTTNVSPTDAGIVTVSPKGNSFIAGAELSVTATPASGYVFKDWTDNSGNVIGDKSVLSYVMPDYDATLTANFFTEADYPEIFTGGPYNAVVGNAEQLLIALRAASSTSESRYRIFLKNGIYDLGKTAMTAVPANTSLIGESQDGVLIMNNPDVIPGGNNYQDLTPTLFIDENQNNIYMQDITVRQARDWETKTSQGQALAIRQRGKQAVYKNVSIEGVQDTYYLNKADGTAYFEDCTVAGEVDFIYGDGTMFFQNCTLLPVSSGAKITAANTKENYMGIVFNDCVIDRHPEAKDAVTGYALGRCWDDSPCVTYLNTTMKVLPLDAGWQGMTDGLLIRYHEYGSKNANGDAIDLSKRSISACKPAQGSHKPVITAEETAGYSLDKVFPAWNPQNVTSQLALDNAPVKTSTSLNWNTVDGAYCYAVVKDGNVIGFTKDTSFALDDANAIYNVRVANMMGGLGVMSADAVAGSNVMPGDANGDGQVSVADLSLMASYVLGSNVTINMQNADVNNDGQISVADLSKVASIILQIEARRSRF